jgi:GT2 family glycosyltransferase
MSSEEKPYAMVAGERVLNEHFERTHRNARAELIGHGYRIDRALPTPCPLASIVIPTRNAAELTWQCVKSIVDRTIYTNYEIIIVDNGSDSPDALELFERLKRNGTARIIRDDGPFNYSAINNNAVRQANGDIIVLMNNDIEVISNDWLSRMVSIAALNEVGAVGAKLLYPDNTIQHAGVIMGLGGLAAHAHWRFPRESLGYVARASLDQCYSAVTAACLAVKRADYFAVGGLNETELTVAYNDVDFCLKLLKLGRKNVWTAFAELYHHESATRGYETSPEKLERFHKEQAYMLKTWPDYISYDPAYNPNLTFGSADFALSFPPRVPFVWKALT